MKIENKFAILPLSSALTVRGSDVSDSLWLHELEPTRLHCPGESPGKNTGVGHHALLEEIFRPRDQTQVSHIAGGFFSICATRDCVCILIPHLINFPREGRDLFTPHSFKEAFFTKDWIKNEAKKWCPKDRSMVGVNLTAVLTLQVSGFF